MFHVSLNVKMKIKNRKTKITRKHQRSKPNHKPVLFGLEGGETQGYRHRHLRFRTKYLARFQSKLLEIRPFFSL